MNFTEPAIWYRLKPQRTDSWTLEGVAEAQKPPNMPKPADEGEP